MSENITITAAETAPRLDQYLAEKFDRSRSFYSALITQGYVLVNGKHQKKSDSVKVGDVISVDIPAEKKPDITPREVAFDIVYETDRYAIINKPAGIAVHPAPGHYDDSLVNGLLYMFAIRDEAGAENFRPGIVHRLDKDTSGLLIVAKDQQARERLSRLFHDRLVEKHYMAVAVGVAKFKETIVDAPIGRDKKHRQRMAVVPDGRAARTAVIVRKQFCNAFLVDIQLFTGRTHQIRVHMKHLGYPLVGDQLYGGANCGKLFHRQALHAYRLAFADPFTGAEVDVRIELAEDMSKLVAGFSC